MRRPPHARLRSHFGPIPVLLAIFTFPATAIDHPAAEAPPTPDPIAGHPPYRRLFLDAMVVEQSSGLEKVFHAAEKHPANPLITKEHAWEGWGPYLYGTVLRDGDTLRMWYQSIGAKGAAILYAESTDGLRWKKPNLGIVSFEGSTENNIVAPANAHIASVIPLPHPTSPDRRWAMYSYGGALGPHVAYSPDGLRWDFSAEPAREKLFSSSDVLNVFFDPYRDRFAATYKTVSRRHRAVGLALSDDGARWRKPIESAVFTADDLDPDATQVYGMPVFPYQGLYIGLPWLYHARYIKYGRYSPERMYEAQAGSPRTVDVQLAWSWDLVNWTRTPDRKPFLGAGPEGAFDSRQVYTARAPVVVGDRLFFYYGGFNKPHDSPGVETGAIGLATLRLDGFCSMHAGAEEGWLISRREVFGTPEVTINARTGPKGYVLAELLDRQDRVIAGFSRAESIPFSGDSARHAMRWKTAAFPDGLKGADKKIRFILKDADLYSYLPSDIDTSIDDSAPDP